MPKIGHILGRGRVKFGAEVKLRSQCSNYVISRFIFRRDCACCLFIVNVNVFLPNWTNPTLCSAYPKITLFVFVLTHKLTADYHKRGIVFWLGGSLASQEEHSFVQLVVFCVCLNIHNIEAILKLNSNIQFILSSCVPTHSLHGEPIMRTSGLAYFYFSPFESKN